MKIQARRKNSYRLEGKTVRLEGKTVTFGFQLYSTLANEY